MSKGKNIIITLSILVLGVGAVLVATNSKVISKVKDFLGIGSTETANPTNSPVVTTEAEYKAICLNILKEAIYEKDPTLSGLEFKTFNPLTGTFLYKGYIDSDRYATIAVEIDPQKTNVSTYGELSNNFKTLSSSDIQRILGYDDLKNEVTNSSYNTFLNNCVNNNSLREAAGINLQGNISNWEDVVKCASVYHVGSGGTIFVRLFGFDNKEIFFAVTANVAGYTQDQLENPQTIINIFNTKEKDYTLLKDPASFPTIEEPEVSLVSNVAQAEISLMAKIDQSDKEETEKGKAKEFLRKVALSKIGKEESNKNTRKFVKSL